MMKFLWTPLRHLFGGGASYLFLGLAAFFLLQSWQIKQIKNDRNQARAERDAAVTLAAERNSVIASQSEQYNRRVHSQKEQMSAEKNIESVPDSQNCIRSAPVNSALNWLREHESRATDPVDD